MRLLNTCLALGLVAGLSTACGISKKNDDQGSDKGPSEELTAEEKAALDAEFSKIPQAAIVRVQLDEEGNPIGSPEMKVAKGEAEGLTTAEAAALAFAGGDAPASVVVGVDELDADTSVQSWTNWGDGNDYSDSNDFDQNQNYYPGQQGPGQGNQSGYKPVPQSNQQHPGQQGQGHQGGGYKPPHQGGGHGGGSSCGQQQSCSCQRSYCHDYWYVGYRPVLYWHGYGWNYGIGRPWYYRHGNYGYYCYRPRRSW